jgi:hypothetical protein
MTKSANLLILGFIALALSACKKGSPEIENLRTLAGFSLDQNSFSVSNKTDPTFILTGTCSPTFTKIEMSFDAGVTWTSAASIAQSAVLNCQTTGKFRLDFSTGMHSAIPANSAAANGIFTFRAVSELGFSDLRQVSILQRQAGSMILAGAHVTTNGTYRLTGRIGGAMTAQTITPGYVLKGTVKPR